MGSITVDEPNVGVIIDGMKVTFPKNTGSADKTYTVHYEEDDKRKATTNVTVRGGNCGCIDESNVTFAANALTITNITVTNLKSQPKIYIRANDGDDWLPNDNDRRGVGSYTTFDQTTGKLTLKEEVRWKEDLGLTVITASTPAIKVVQFGCDPVIKRLSELSPGPKLSLEIENKYLDDCIEVWYKEWFGNTQHFRDYKLYIDHITVSVPYYQTKNRILGEYVVGLHVENNSSNPLKLLDKDLSHYIPDEPYIKNPIDIDRHSYIYLKNAKVAGTIANNMVRATEDKWIELTDGSNKMILVHLQYNHPRDGEPIDDDESGPIVIPDDPQIH